MMNGAVVDFLHLEMLFFIYQNIQNTKMNQKLQTIQTNYKMTNKLNKTKSLFYSIKQLDRETIQS